MRDEDKTKDQLTNELTKLQEINSEIETPNAQFKQVEGVIFESGEEYRSFNSILDTTKVGIFILDSDFRVVFLNQVLERYFGIKRAEVIGKDKRQLIRKRIKNIFEDPDIFAEKVLATYENNTYVENFECHLLPNDGCKERWLEHWSQPISSGPYAGGRIEHYTDITERKWAEEALRDSMVELENKNKSLESLNTALRVLLKRRDEDKVELEEKVLLNVKDLVLPYLEKLKKTSLDARQKDYISILESKLNDIISPFSQKLSSKYLNLTPTEINVANLIKEGKTTKEIAEFFNLSIRTIETHRGNIRRKLDIKHKKANLRSHLLFLK
jgi:PAS domain S-box-containing protein